MMMIFFIFYFLLLQHQFYTIYCIVLEGVYLTRPLITLKETPPHPPQKKNPFRLIVHPIMYFLISKRKIDVYSPILSAYVQAKFPSTLMIIIVPNPNYFILFKIFFFLGVERDGQTLIRAKQQPIWTLQREKKLLKKNKIVLKWVKGCMLIIGVLVVLHITIIKGWPWIVN
jgi:hypothetical protein